MCSVVGDIVHRINIRAAILVLPRAVRLCTRTRDQPQFDDHCDQLGDVTCGEGVGVVLRVTGATPADEGHVQVKLVSIRAGSLHDESLQTHNRKAS